jgi:hypothetical protein
MAGVTIVLVVMTLACVALMVTWFRLKAMRLPPAASPDQCADPHEARLLWESLSRLTQGDEKRVRQIVLAERTKDSSRGEIDILRKAEVELLWRDLLCKTLGDNRVAERLVGATRGSRPLSVEAAALRRAIEEWEQDHRSWR